VQGCPGAFDEHGIHYSISADQNLSQGFLNMSTSQAFLEVEKVQLEVKQERERTDKELMLLMWNLSTSQDYVAQILGGIV